MESVTWGARRSRVLVGAAVLALFGFGNASFGTDRKWIGDQVNAITDFNGSFSISSNWFGSVVPGASDRAMFGVGNTVVPSPANGNFNYSPTHVYFGDFVESTPAGDAFIAGGTATVANLVVATGAWTFDFGSGSNDGVHNPAPSTGALNVTPPPGDTGDGYAVVGSSDSGSPGNATLNILHGSVSGISGLDIGVGVGVQGLLHVDGTNAQVVAQTIHVGQQGGTGTLEVVNGATVRTNSIGYGGNFGPLGQVNTGIILVSGIGSSLTGLGSLEQGSLTVSGGGQLSSLNMNNVKISPFIGVGAFSGTPAITSVVATITDPGSTWTGIDRLTVGGVYHTDTKGQGTLKVYHSASVVANSLEIANRTSGPESLVDIFDGASVSINGPVEDGDQGIGRISIASNGAILTSTLGEVGVDTTGQGTIQVQSGGTWTDTGYLRIGAKGAGIMSINIGGVVHSQFGEIASQSGSTGNVSIIGPAANTLSGPGGQWIVDNTLSIGGTASGAGGSGALSVGTNASLTVGDHVQIWAGGKLSGGGTILGKVVNAGGIVAPGNSPGTLTVSGDYTQTSGTLDMELGGINPGDFDQLIVTGTATLGGTLQIDLYNGFQPSPGETFQLFNFTALKSGSHFDNLILPTLPSNFLWDTTSLLTSGTVTVTPEPASLALLGSGLLLLLRRNRLI